jgi:gamma-glutamylcyclotransferase (GGCT)/AIG2-like uncharacterized protein YtfP
MNDRTDAAGHEVAVGDRVGLALFAYGTLTFGEIVEALLGRALPVTPAVLPGWRVARLPGRPYPGLVPEPGRVASGFLIRELAEADWAFLDAWEGAPYRVRQVKPVAGSSPGPGPGMAALTYAWRDLADVEPTDWDPDWFSREWLEAYRARLGSRPHGFS